MNEIVKQYLDGQLTQAEAVAKAGVSRGKFRAAVLEAAGPDGLPPRNRTRVRVNHDDVIAMWKTGVPVAAVAKHFGCSPITVYGILRKQRLSGQKGRVSLVEMARMFDMYRNGMTATEIGWKLGRAPSTVLKMVRQGGGLIRGRGPGPSSRNAE